MMGAIGPSMTRPTVVPARPRTACVRIDRLHDLQAAALLYRVSNPAVQQLHRRGPARPGGHRTCLPRASSVNPMLVLNSWRRR